jgi:hypothetical protein
MPAPLIAAVIPLVVRLHIGHAMLPAAVVGHMCHVIHTVKAPSACAALRPWERLEAAWSKISHTEGKKPYFVRPTPLEREENSEESFGLLEEGIESEV